MEALQYGSVLHEVDEGMNPAKEILFRAWFLLDFEGFYHHRMNQAKRSQYLLFWSHAQQYAEWKTSLLKRRTF